MVKHTVGKTNVRTMFGVKKWVWALLYMITLPKSVYLFTMKE